MEKEEVRLGWKGRIAATAIVVAGGTGLFAFCEDATDGWRITVEEDTQNPWDTTRPTIGGKYVDTTTTSTTEASQPTTTQPPPPDCVMNGELADMPLESIEPDDPTFIATYILDLPSDAKIKARRGVATCAPLKNGQVDVGMSDGRVDPLCAAVGEASGEEFGSPLRWIICIEELPQ